MKFWKRLKEGMTREWDRRAPFVFLSDPLVHPEEAGVVTLDVPGYRQIQSYTCGYVAGMMVLHTFKPRASDVRFWNKCRPDPDEGMSQGKLVRALRSSGVKVGERKRFTHEDLHAAISAGKPVITTVTLPTTDHWIVVYGVGVSPKRVFIAGNGMPWLKKNKVMTWGEFVRMKGGVDGGLVCAE
jgi:hypothetical protein